MEEDLFEIAESQEKKKATGNPFYMRFHTLTKDTILGTGEMASVTFSPKDRDNYKYAWVAIYYFKGDESTFEPERDLLKIGPIGLEDSYIKAVCDSMIRRWLGSGTLIKVRARDIIITQLGRVALDLCYQRKGNPVDSGPVTVHIFCLQNVDEAVHIIISYHDKDKDKYKDLFNVINTFDWAYIKKRKP